MIKFTAKNGILQKHVLSTRGKPYAHRCPLKTLQEVIEAILAITETGETAVSGFIGRKEFTLKILKQRLPLVPDSQVAVSFDFLLHHCIVRRISESAKAPCVLAMSDPWTEALEQYHYLEYVCAGGSPDDLSDEDLAMHIVVEERSETCPS